MTSTGVKDSGRLWRELIGVVCGAVDHNSSIRILEAISDEFEADAAVIWRMTDDLQRAIPTDQFIRPDGSEQVAPFWHSLSRKAPTAGVLRSVERKPLQVSKSEIESFRLDHPGDNDFKVLDYLKVQSFAIMPFGASSQNGNTLNLYWRGDRRLNEAEEKFLENVADMLPKLDQALEQRSSFDLVGKIAVKTERRAQARPTASAAIQKQLKEDLREVVKLIAETLNVGEASVYLEHKSEHGSFLLRYASWGRLSEQYLREKYQPGEGITGYAYGRGKSIHIPNLFEFDADAVAQRHPGLTTSLPPKVLAEIGRGLPHDQEGNPRPLGCIALPMMAGDVPFGVLRVTGPDSVPYQFQERDIALLRIVERQIGEWCYGHLRLMNASAELAWYKTLTAGLTQSNERLNRKLVGTQGFKAARVDLVKEALELSQQIFHQADAVNIYLADADAEKPVLRLADIAGRLWEDCSANEQKKLKEQTFAISSSASNIPAVEAYRTNRYLLVLDAENSSIRSLVFPKARSMLVIPVSHGHHKYGTLALLAKRREVFGEQEMSLGNLLGRQLGLYLHVVEIVAKLRESEAQQKEALEILQRTFENLQHQLKNPVILAVRRAERLERTASTKCPSLEQDAAALKAICRRAEYIVQNVRLFAALARDEVLPLSPAALTQKNLYAMLESFRKDYELLIHQGGQKINIVVHPSGLEKLNEMTVSVDLRLLEQILGNLLENATKYSYSPSTIDIRCGTTTRNQTTYFFVAVANRGIPISAENAKRLAERGQRGDRAAMLRRMDKQIQQNAEGSGLGLYLVKEIISDHKGILEIEPTNVQTGVTEFRLLFPEGVKGI